MHREYAVDPEHLCQNWDRFWRVFEGFGFDKGRLISRYPKDWLKRVADSLNTPACAGLSEMQRKRVVDRLNREKKENGKVVSFGRSEHPASTWLEIAEQSHGQQPFHTIIAEQNPRATAGISLFDDLGDDWKPDLPWKSRREAKALSACARILLRTSSEIVFVDPYFCFEDRFLRTMKEFLLEPAKRAADVKCIEIHLGFPAKDPSFRYSLIELERRAQHLYLPPALLNKVVFHVWKDTRDDKLHARYVLTEKGGLAYDAGLDEDKASEAVTDVHLLDSKAADDRRRNYRKETSPFEHLMAFRPAGAS